jgi:hypothetical protein
MSRCSATATQRGHLRVYMVISARRTTAEAEADTTNNWFAYVGSPSDESVRRVTSRL